MSGALFWALYWLALVLAILTVWPAVFWAVDRIDRMVARDRKPWAPPVAREVYDPRITWHVQDVGPEQPLPPLHVIGDVEYLPGARVRFR